MKSYNQAFVSGRLLAGGRGSQLSAAPQLLLSLGDGGEDRLQDRSCLLQLGTAVVAGGSLLGPTPVVPASLGASVGVGNTPATAAISS